ncbi:hypothetical protein J3E68DRAFT_400559 [Trichoderma sp. SZMC 28012]
MLQEPGEGRTTDISSTQRTNIRQICQLQRKTRGFRVQVWSKQTDNAGKWWHKTTDKAPEHGVGSTTVVHYLLYASLLATTIPIPIPISSGSMCSVTAAREQSCWGLSTPLLRPVRVCPAFQLPITNWHLLVRALVCQLARKKLGTLGL